MFVTCNALLTNLTFGKGESQTAKHFLSFDSPICTMLIIYLLYSLFLIQKELRLQQFVNTKSKSGIQHPPMIGTHFWKIRGYLTKIFYRFLFRKLKIGCKTTTTFDKYELFHWNCSIPISSLSITFKRDTNVLLIYLWFIRREFDLSASYGSSFLTLLIISELFLQENSANIW